MEVKLLDHKAPLTGRWLLDIKSNLSVSLSKEGAFVLPFHLQVIWYSPVWFPNCCLEHLCYPKVCIFPLGGEAVIINKVIIASHACQRPWKFTKSIHLFQCRIEYIHSILDRFVIWSLTFLTKTFVDNIWYHWSVLPPLECSS